MEIPFRCGVANGSEGGFCRRPSTCMIQNGVEMCVNCGTGWGNERAWLHLDNCYQPDWYFPLLLGLSTTAGWLGAFTLLWKLHHGLHRKLRTMTKWYVATLAFEWIEHLTLYLEGGRFIVSNIAVAMHTLVATEFIVQLTIVLLRSVSPALRDVNLRRIEQLWKKLAFVPGIVFSILCCIAAALAYAEDARYNTIAFASLLCSSAIFVVLIGSSAGLMHYVIRKSFFIGFFGPISVAITLIVLGSVPYAWILGMFVSGFFATVPGFVWFLNGFETEPYDTGDLSKTKPGQSFTMKRQVESSYRAWSSRRYQNNLPTVALTEAVPTAPEMAAESENEAETEEKATSPPLRNDLHGSELDRM